MNTILTGRTQLRRLILYAGVGAFAAACSKDAPIITPPPSPTIALSTSAVTFNDTLGTSAPAPATVSLTNSGGGTLSGLSLGTITYSAGATGWLTATLSSTTGPADITFQVASAGLPAGTFTATVPVLSSAADNSPATVTVTYGLATAAALQGVEVLAVGNVRCTSANIGLIASIVDNYPNATVLPLGDLTFNGGGTAQDFSNCYGPNLGRALSRTYAVLGSWDADTTGHAPGAQAYFGDARIGPNGQNFYSFDIGTWHVLMLNVVSGGKITYGNNSSQLNFVTADLAANASKKCTLAVWHDPMWYSSATDTAGQMYPNEHPNQSGIWRELYNANADVIINGGEHTYERMNQMRWDQQTAKPVADSVRGLVQFNNGLGGDGAITPTFMHPNSAYVGQGVGVLRLVLGDSTFTWQFINAPGSTVTDSGSGKCH